MAVCGQQLTEISQGRCHIAEERDRSECNIRPDCFRCFRSQCEQFEHGQGALREANVGDLIWFGHEQRERNGRVKIPH